MLPTDGAMHRNSENFNMKNKRTQITELFVHSVCYKLEGRKLAEWCKILELKDGHKALMVRKYDDEEEMEAIEITFDFDGARAIVKHNFDSVEKAEKAFNELIQIESVQKVRDGIAKQRIV